MFFVRWFVVMVAVVIYFLSALIPND